MIELHEDALVQYDELDALFAQFVVNHSVGGTVLLYTLQIVRLCALLYYVRVAQFVEAWIVNHAVGGSSPGCAKSTKSC